MKYKNILFDLDGTLTDSSPGIINAYNYSLNKLGLTEDDISIVKSYIGSPLRAYYAERQKLSAGDSELAVKYFREHYNDTGIFENSVYPGISELLEKLYSSGHKLYIATSKPEKFAITVLEHFGISRYFAYIKGSDMSPDNKPKDKIINHVMETNSLVNSECIMIGDRYHDIRGAHINSIASIAVTYGYGSREELEKENPTHFAGNAEEIKTLLIK